MNTNTPLLLDIGPLSCGCTDHVLNDLHKALADPPDDSIWQPHHDLYVRDHIEDVTQRGLALLDGILSGLLSLFGLELRKAETWRRWTPEELDAVMRELDGKDPREYTLPDWLRVIDNARSMAPQNHASTLAELQRLEQRWAQEKAEALATALNVLVYQFEERLIATATALREITPVGSIGQRYRMDRRLAQVAQTRLF